MIGRGLMRGVVKHSGFEGGREPLLGPGRDFAATPYCGWRSIVSAYLGSKYRR